MSIKRIIIATILALIIITIGIGIGIGIASNGKISIARNHNAAGRTHAELHGGTARLTPLVHHRGFKQLATNSHAVLTLDVHNVL